MSRGFLFEWCCVLRVQRVTVQGFFVLIASIDGHSRSLVLRYSMHHSWIAISVPNSIVIVWFMSLITSTVYHYRDVTIINVKKLQFIHDWCQVCSSRLTTEHCQDTWSCRRIPHGECLQIHQRVADRYRGFGAAAEMHSGSGCLHWHGRIQPQDCDSDIVVPNTLCFKKKSSPFCFSQVRCWPISIIFGGNVAE